jgi:hypothetical protein
MIDLFFSPWFAVLLVVLSSAVNLVPIAENRIRFWALWWMR